MTELDIFPKEIDKIIKQYCMDKIQEIRMRVNKPLIIYADREYVTRYIVTKQNMKETIGYISHYSLYAYEDEMRQGYLTIQGGHRIGITGTTILDNQKIRNMKQISSINVRVAKEQKGCASSLIKYVFEDQMFLHTMIISPPGAGKTTLLRDMIRLLSDGTKELNGQSVGVVDERSEIGASYNGVLQNYLGIRTDVLDGCPKADGMLMLIRSMSPKIIAVDEIGSEKDIHALKMAMNCGCKMLVTVHGNDLEDIKRKPEMKEMINKHYFERYIILNAKNHPGTIASILDSVGNELLQ